MSPDALLADLIGLFPDFRSHWEAPDNRAFWAQGKTIIHLDVFASFAGFFMRQNDDCPSDRLAALGALVSRCMVPTSDSLVDDAARCFVDNVASKSCGRALGQYLVGDARRAWLCFGGEPNEQERAHLRTQERELSEQVAQSMSIHQKLRFEKFNTQEHTHCLLDIFVGEEQTASMDLSIDNEDRGVRLTIWPSENAIKLTMADLASILEKARPFVEAEFANERALQEMLAARKNEDEEKE